MSGRLLAGSGLRARCRRWSLGATTARTRSARCRRRDRCASGCRWLLILATVAGARWPARRPSPASLALRHRRAVLDLVLRGFRADGRDASPRSLLLRGVAAAGRASACAGAVGRLGSRSAACVAAHLVFAGPPWRSRASSRLGPVPRVPERLPVRRARRPHLRLRSLVARRWRSAGRLPGLGRRHRASARPAAPGAGPARTSGAARAHGHDAPTASSSSTTSSTAPPTTCSPTSACPLLLIAAIWLSLFLRTETVRPGCAPGAVGLALAVAGAAALSVAWSVDRHAASTHSALAHVLPGGRVDARGRSTGSGTSRPINPQSRRPASACSIATCPGETAQLVLVAPDLRHRGPDAQRAQQPASARRSDRATSFVADGRASRPARGGERARGRATACWWTPPRCSCLAAVRSGPGRELLERLTPRIAASPLQVFALREIDQRFRLRPVARQAKGWSWSSSSARARSARDCERRPTPAPGGRARCAARASAGRRASGRGCRPRSRGCPTTPRSSTSRPARSSRARSPRGVKRQ